MNANTIRPLIIYSCIFALSILSRNKIFSQCTSTGPFSGTTFADDGSIGSFAFSSPGNAAASDNSRTSASAILALLVGNSHYLKATGFGFSIPVTASICGITVEVEKSAANISGLAWVTDNSIRLIKGGTVVGSDYNTIVQWPSSESYYSYGSSSDLWGTTWSAADINATNFGVAFSAALNGIVILLPSARIDHIRVTVDYLNGALPLKLINFSAFAQSDHSVKLEWATASNDEEAIFTIQRSSNGSDWINLHDMRSEVSAGDKTYQYTDFAYTNNIAWYRLQVKHATGNSSYSKTIIVKHKESSITLFPNPATDHIYVSPKTAARSIQCFGMGGRKVQITYIREDNDLYKIDISRLSPGSYILCIDEKKRLFVKN